MPRNFCGCVDLKNERPPLVASQMADKLNINSLYQLQESQLSRSHFIGLYSESFPAHQNDSFVIQMSDRYIITSFSMLIRLDELSKKLGLFQDLSYLADEELILRSYLKWGKEAVYHLEGDWAFAIWDCVEEELFLARNAHGDGTLFYHHNGSKFFFSSILTGLVGIDGIPNETDKEKLFMESLTASGFQSRTLYKDIHFLQPGHYIIFSKSQLQLSQYWTPLENPKTNFKKDDEYFEAFYEAYDRAVRDRLALSERWGFAVSGGLDSAATIGIVSQYYKERNETAEALCYTPNPSNFNKYNSKKKYGGEGELAQRTADFNGNIHLNLITKKDGFWDTMTDYSRDFGGPPHMTSIWFVDALARGARNNNMNMVMNGQGGNQGLSYEGVPSHISISQFAKDLRQGLRHNLSNAELVRFLAKSVYFSGKKTLKNVSGSNQKTIAKILNGKTLLSDQFIKSVNGYELLKTHYFGENYRLTEGEFKFRKRLKPGKHCRLGLWNQIGTAYDVVFVDPSRDKRFLELICSFPNHVFHRKGEPKFLFKQAFKHMVSPVILNNKKEGINMSDLIERYQSDMPHFQSLLASKEKDSLFNELIDPEKLKAFYKVLDEETEFPESFVYQLKSKSASLFQALLT